jgi:hypothetical protein
VKGEARPPARWVVAYLLFLLLTMAGPHPDSRAFANMTPAPLAAPDSAPQLPSPAPILAAVPPDQPGPMIVPPVSPSSSGLASSHRARKPMEPKRDDETEDPESALLATALQRLHREHDASGALSLLEAYPRRFPRGQLAGEVALVEAEALLKLGRREALVERLDPDIVGKYPRAPELALLRAEALSKLGRCAEALPAFSALLDGPLEPQTRERALFGRALCRATVGRSEGAREDLARLLVEFPSEKPKIARVLESLEP